MLLKIFKNRTVSSSGTWGTKNENNYEILNFEFPEELEEYNKRIVYYLGNQKVWDAIIDNKAILTNAITTKGSVKAYIWCTKSDEAFETDVDFRTQIFVMNFFENENADGIVPTPEQVDGFNTMLTAMNNKITEINELETTIENAETQRQENEETRQNNENTRQENEQIRQEQEAERERRTDEAIGEIEDLTEEYNQNAQEKTNAFNQNAIDKMDVFNSNAESKTNTFNTNATNKTNAFNSNATEKTTTFNNNVSTKTSEFNTNASDKTTAFDNNASSKTSAFNTNAESKTNTFNDNATQKITDFNNNAQAKTDAFDEHTAEITADIEDLQQEVEELSENMPWNTTEQATEISVDDAAKYSKNKLELFGNTSQDSTSISGGDEYDSPSPDHPQPIHVVTGENTIKVQGKNLIPGEVFEFCTITNTGVKTQDSTRICTDFIELDPAKQYFLSASVNYGFSGIAFYDNTYTYISRLYWNNSREHTIETTAIPSNTKYAKVFGQRVNSEIASTNEFKEYEWYLEEGNSNNTKYVPYYHADYPINLGNIKLCKIGTNQYCIFKNTQGSEYYSSTLIENGWYYIPIFFQEINNADSFNRNTCEGDSSKFYYSMRLNSDIQSVNFNYKQTGLINYGKVNQHARQTVRGLYQGFNLGAKVLYLYTDEDSTLTLEQFNAKWNEKLQNIPIQVYALKEDRTPVQITDETLISQLDAVYEHLKLVKGTNNISITASDLKPYMQLSYMQDLKSKLDNLDSRLALLE